METGVPSRRRIVSMVLFAMSCIGLLLFLWVEFGGTVPFNPQGYRVKVAFPYAQQLASQSDVRIAGVSVGKVVGTQLDPRGNRTIATLQLSNQYAPIRSDAQAMLRLKTILGETYVELQPGSPSAPALRDGGLLARSHVTQSVQLDDIFGAFDPATRRAFQQWNQQLATAIRRNDQNLNSVLGNLPTFAADATDILRVLDIEHSSVVRLAQNGGTVFAALTRDQNALRNLITTGETTFATTAAQNNSLALAFQRFPAFLDQTKATMVRLKSFSLDTDPLLIALQPAINDLAPTLHSVRLLSAPLRHLFVQLGPLITVSKTGLPAIADTLRGAKPLLGELGPFLEQLNPIFTWLSLHQQLISDFIYNGAAPIASTTTSIGGGGTGHYLRQFSPIGPETLSLASVRGPNNRGNTYPGSLWLSDARNLALGNYGSWDCKNTGAGGDGSVSAVNVPVVGHEACWVADPQSGAPAKSTNPQVTATKYSTK
jgi:virulence factor Mce-like protein